jgi:hypothetical protein
LLRFLDYTQIHHSWYDCSGLVIGNTHMHLVGFEPAIPASEPLKTVRVSSGIGQRTLHTSGNMENVRNAQKQMPQFTRGALQLQRTSQTGIFRVSKRVSFHPPPPPKVGPVQTEQELQENDSDSPTELER